MRTTKTRNDIIELFIIFTFFNRFISHLFYNRKLPTVEFI
jgi:hypothetical protein